MWRIFRKWWIRHTDRIPSELRLNKYSSFFLRSWSLLRSSTDSRQFRGQNVRYVFTRARHWTAIRSRRIQSTPFTECNCHKYNNFVFFLLSPALSSCLFYQGLQDEVLHSILSSVLHYWTGTFSEHCNGKSNPFHDTYYFRNQTN
jgi:hypothetical protein